MARRTIARPAPEAEPAPIPAPAPAPAPEPVETRVILVPNRANSRARAVPDFLGMPPTLGRYTVVTHYRDVLKVAVTAPTRVLDDLHARSRAHFARIWGGQPSR